MTLVNRCQLGVKPSGARRSARVPFTLSTVNNTDERCMLIFYLAGRRDDGRSAERKNSRPTEAAAQERAAGGARTGPLCRRSSGTRES